jgi:hypothetical protein
MNLSGSLVWIVLMGMQTSSPPSVTGTSLLCGSVTGRTVRDRDDAIGFCSDEITPGVITDLVADNSTVRIRVTARLADAMREDRSSGEELVVKWLRRWRTVTSGTAVTLLVESNGVEIVRGAASADRADQVIWGAKD